MSRYQNPFIGNTAYGQGQSTALGDISQAGAEQFAPNLGNLAANTPYVRRNVIPFLIEAPRFFNFMPDPEIAVRCLKALVETHSRTVDGLNQQIRVDTADAPIGGSGERIQVPINVTREVSSPNHGAWELQGRAITKFCRWWIVNGIGDENTKVPLVVSSGAIKAEDYDISFAGATILYIEPDPTMTEVVDAWLCSNMYPLATPPWEGSKDASQMGTDLPINIEFTAITDVSMGTMLYARQLLQSLNLAGLNPNDNPLWMEGVSADVANAEVGLRTQLAEGADRRITY